MSAAAFRGCASQPAAVANVWSSSGTAGSPASRFRDILLKPGIVVAPCCFDGLSARLIQRRGFPVTFLSGFGVAASMGMPDTGLVTYTEMMHAVGEACSVLDTCLLIADADTGFGNAVNVKRTVVGMAQRGAAMLMIEDQVAPKRCGFVAGKSVVTRGEAEARIRAAVDARKEGADILILARTDALASDGLDEAIARCSAFRRLGADATFLSGLKTTEDMARYCREVDGPKVHNNNSAGCVLPPSQLEKLGYSLVIYPDLMLSAGIKAMDTALTRLHSGFEVSTAAYADIMLPFQETCDIVGFSAYKKESDRYDETPK